MRGRSALSLLLAALALLLSVGGVRAADSWLMSGHDAQHSNFNSGERKISAATIGSLHHVWLAPAISSAVATDQRVFAVVAGSDSRGVVALDSATGRLLGRYRRAAGATTLAYARGRLIAAAPRTTWILDPILGKMIWSGPGASSLTADGGRVYTGSSCLPSECARTFPAVAIGLGSDSVFWRHPGGGNGDPVITGGHLYQVWSTPRSQTRVYDPMTGRLLASLSLTGAWLGDRSGTYVVTTRGANGRRWAGKVRPDGRLAWKVDLGKPVPGSPALAYGTLFLQSNRFHPGLIAISAASGQLSWAADLGAGLSLAVANHLVFVLHTQAGTVDALNAASGKVLRSFPVFGWKGPSPGGSLFVSGGTLYVLHAGGLTALRP